MYIKKLILFFIIILILPLTLLISKKETKVPNTARFVPKRSEQPKDTEVLKGNVPVHYWQTEQETPVYFVPTENLPIVDVFISFDAGSARDQNLPGLASFCANLLSEGSQKYDASQISEQFENVGAEFNTRVTRDRLLITLRTLSDQDILENVSTLLSEVLAYPSFNETSITQIRNRTMIELKQNKEQADVIAFRTLYSMLYPDHPYGHLVSGTMESIAKITREDLIHFHKNYIVSKNAILTIVGGIPRDLALEMSNRIVKNLTQGTKPKPLPEAKPLAESETKHVPFHSKQTHILIGSSFILENDKDYYALQLGNYILGDNPLVARLYKELREKRGYTYSIGSTIRRFLAGGLFVMNTQTKNAVADAAFNESKKTIQTFIEFGPTEIELEEAKRGLLGAFALSISDNYKIADTISELTFYRIPLEYLNNYPNVIKNLNRTTVHDTFKKYIQTDKMAVVLVGE